MPDEPEEDVADLPKREAMSLLSDPTSLLGSLGGTTGSPSATPPTDATQSTPGSGLVPTVPTINTPHMPVPEQNPGGAYSPDVSSTSQT